MKTKSTIQQKDLYILASYIHWSRTWKETSAFTSSNEVTVHHDDADAYLPHNLNGTPQIEDEEHNGPVVHFFQTTKNNEEDKIPSNHLIREQNPSK